MEYIAAIITAIGTIIIAWFKYDQTRKDEMTKLEIEKIRSENTQKRKRANYCSGVIFGQLWKVLYVLNADRVYIVQPHPLGNECLLSIYYEVLQTGINGMHDEVQNLKMSEVPKFSEELARNLFMKIDDIDKVVDKRAKAMLSMHGSKMLVVKKLCDNSHDWVGSIFCEFTHGKMECSEEQAREVLHDVAMTVQFILPEFKS